MAKSAPKLVSIHPISEIFDTITYATNKQNNTMKKQETKKCQCGGEYYSSRGCGVLVCEKCGDHKGLARCYCGWAADGGNGRHRLQEMGEQIDEE